MAKLGNDEGGSGAGAEAENHAGLDIIHGLVCGELLEVVLGEGWSGEGFDGEGFMGVSTLVKEFRGAQDKGSGGVVVEGGEGEG